MSDAVQRDPQRSARLAAARRLHPDLGGDAEEFVRVMDALSRRPAPVGTASRAAAPVVVVTPRRRVQRRVGAAGRSLADDVRARLPRSFPGARRYGHL